MNGDEEAFMEHMRAISTVEYRCNNVILSHSYSDYWTIAPFVQEREDLSVKAISENDVDEALKVINASPALYEEFFQLTGSDTDV